MKTLTVLLIFVTLGLAPAVVEALAPYAFYLLAFAAGVGVTWFIHAWRNADADAHYARTHRVTR